MSGGVNKIKRLDQQVIQKIAAGEIVERPAHIVKELLENALDAGATHITVSVNHGGKDLIMVEDNGSGMNCDDALLSVEHHTTSKLERVEDLETLHTYGFRGEALSSISSVSKMAITTRDVAHSEGCILHVVGGVVESTRPAAALVGTTIRVEDLFFNVPARKKFLKKDATELNHIKQLFHATCFQALSVYFRFSSDDRILFSCPGVLTVSDRFFQLEGIETQSHMLPLVPVDCNGVMLSGLISDTQYVSYDRSDIFVFVNNRWIKNTSVIRALINGYENSLPPQKYPRAVLYITVNPAEVDINIHPKKEEVRFLHPRRVEQMIQEAVRKTLESKVPNRSTPQREYMRSSLLYQPIMNNTIPVNSEVFAPKKHGSMPDVFKQEGHTELTQVTAPIVFNQQLDSITSHETQKQIRAHESFVPIGQIFNTYILATADTTLYIIDQHAAHERIVFERLVSHHQGLLAVKQAFPLLVSMPEKQQQILLRFEHLFASSGILIESFDMTHILVTATPARITQHNLEDLFHAMLILIEKETMSQELIEKKLLHHIRCHIACKAAVKAGDQLDTIAIMQLMSDLASVPNRFCCPHGRPTIWEITISDLEKWFKRRM